MYQRPYVQTKAKPRPHIQYYRAPNGQIFYYQPVFVAQHPVAPTYRQANRLYAAPRQAAVKPVTPSPQVPESGYAYNAYSHGAHWNRRDEGYNSAHPSNQDSASSQMAKSAPTDAPKTDTNAAANQSPNSPQTPPPPGNAPPPSSDSQTQTSQNGQANPNGSQSTSTNTGTQANPSTSTSTTPTTPSSSSTSTSTGT